MVQLPLYCEVLISTLNDVTTRYISYSKKMGSATMHVRCTYVIQAYTRGRILQLYYLKEISSTLKYISSHQVGERVDLYYCKYNNSYP